MQRRKYWLLLFLVLFFLAAASPCAAADIVNVKADSAILVDAESGRILFGKEPERQLPPASMTKLMTLLLGVMALEDGRAMPNDKVTTTENAWRLGGSQIYLEPGEEMTYHDMLVAVAVGSANDACVAVSEHLEGSHESFVEKMNQTAKQLKMKNTHFVNAYGLPDPKHYTSAHDMARLAVFALKHPRILEYTSIKEYSLRNGEFKLFNTNKLLWWYRGADGFKTGWTNEAKYCLVSTVKRNGLRLVAVVMGSPEPRGNFRDSIALYNYGFARYAFKSFGERGSIHGLVKVGKGQQEAVEAVAERSIGVVCLKGEENQLVCRKSLASYLNAPIRAGQTIGTAKILRDGKVIKTVRLIARQSIPKRQFKESVQRTWSEIFF
ncbi:MAG: D-alanyl-D-alanine carboxypeptidase family protein [Solirubrobacterales bacterium]